MLFIVGRAKQPAGHSHTREPGFPHWTIGLIRQGRSRVRSGGATLSVGSGEMLLIRPSTAYTFQMPDGGEESWAVLAPPPSWEELLAWPEGTPGIAVVPAGPHAGESFAAFREAERWWTDGSPRRAALALNAIERCLLLRSIDRPGEAWADLHPGVRLALAYLAGGPDEKVSIASLARRCSMSPSHLAHTFAEQVGEPPLAWLEGRRIARAQQLLLTSAMPVKRIATACGFTDGEHLSRRFRARTGQSPGAWRARPGAG